MLKKDDKFSKVKPLAYEGGADTLLGDLQRIEDHPDYFTMSEGFMMIMKNSIFPIIGMLFHPSYMMVNAKVLGQVINNGPPCTGKNVIDGVLQYECLTAEVYLASFGIGSSTMSIAILATGSCFILGLTNICP